MTWTITARQRADEALLSTARASQALVILAVDRVVGVGDGKTPPVVKRLRRLPVAMGLLLLDDPARFVDDGYDALQRLIGLHREFAQRLFEAMDPQEDVLARSCDVGEGQVVPFRRRAHPAS